LFGGDSAGLEHGLNDKLVVLGALLDKLDGGLQVVEEAMNIGEEDGDFASGSEVLRNLDGGDEVTAVRSTGSRSALGIYVSSLA
jgi:hypothetical protein